MKVLRMNPGMFKFFEDEFPDRPGGCLTDLQNMVGGYIEAHRLGNMDTGEDTGLYILCNEDARLIGAAKCVHCWIGVPATLYGPVAVCRVKNGDFASVESGDLELVNRITLDDLQAAMHF